MTTCLRAPSVKTLQTRLAMDLEGATALRKLLVKWREAPADERADAADAALNLANHVLYAYDVEALRATCQWDSYYGDTVALYVNRGDTYEPTLLYDVRKESWWVGSLGDWWERQESLEL